MTPKEFNKAMTNIEEDLSGDVEMSHYHADELLCKALREAGYGDGVDTYEKMGKWYA